MPYVLINLPLCNYCFISLPVKVRWVATSAFSVVAPLSSSLLKFTLPLTLLCFRCHTKPFLLIQMFNYSVDLLNWFFKICIQPLLQGSFRVFYDEVFIGLIFNGLNFLFYDCIFYFVSCLEQISEETAYLFLKNCDQLKVNPTAGMENIYRINV